MGWTSLPRSYFGKNTIVNFYNNEFCSDSKFYNEKYEKVDYSVKGNVIYELIKEKDKEEYFISIILFSVSDNEIMYKCMTESCFPYYCDCPIKYLKKSTCQNELSIKYREKCFEIINNKRKLKEIIKNLKVGDIIKVNGNNSLIQFIQDYSHKVKGNFVGTVINTGETFRFKYSKIEI